MYIRYDNTVRLIKLNKSADIHILTDFSNHSCKLLAYCNACISLPRLSQKCINICCFCLYCLYCNFINKITEYFILCNKVCLTVNFYHRSCFAVFAYINRYNTLSRNSSGFLCCLCKSVLTKELHCLFNISVCISKCLLTIHHSGTGQLS